MTIIFLLNAAIGIWMNFDGKKRRFPVLLWCVSVIIFGPLVFPIYLAKRPLLHGEIREGGTLWNILKYFALFWTVYLLAAWIVGVSSASQLDPSTDGEKAAAGFGILIGTGFLFVMWFFPMLSALILGLFLKKNSIVEHGPTVHGAAGISDMRVLSPYQPNSSVKTDGEDLKSHSTSSHLMNLLADAMSSFGQTSKDASRLVARKTERTKLVYMTLPAAYRALGKYCFEKEHHRSVCEDYFLKAEQINSELAKLKDLPTNESASKSISHNGKSTVKRFTNMAQSKTLSVKLGAVFAEIGKAVFDHFPEESEPEEFKTPLRDGLSRLNILDKELADLSEVGNGSWITPKRLVFAVAGLLVVLLIGMLGERKDSDSVSSMDNHSEQASQHSGYKTANKRSDNSKKETYEVGDEFQLGKFRYRVSGATMRNMIGSQFASETASNGATFVIVKYSIENCSDQSQTVWADDLKLVDSKGRKYESSSRANTAMMFQGEKSDFAISELQPGIPRSQETAFEIPNSALDGELILVVPTKGGFMSKQAKVKLR